MRPIESCHTPLSPVDLIRVLADLVPAREPTWWTHMKVYEGMAYGLSQVWIKTEATVQRNSIEENKNK